MILSGMEFIMWHYLSGWRWYWKRVWLNLRKLFHFFSFWILIKTLLAPWKRLTVDNNTGFDIGKFFENLSFNIISVMIGAIVRFGLIIFSLTGAILYLTVSIIFFLVWWLVPFFWLGIL